MKQDQTPDRRRRLFLAAGVAGLALALGACGKRGPLEPPPGSPEAAKLEEGRQQNTVAMPGLRGGAKRPPPISRPKDPFILDPLLD